MSGTVTVNSNPRPLPAGGTLLSLLEELRLSPDWAIVERNGTVVPRARLATVPVAPGDRIEIIQAVAGG